MGIFYQVKTFTIKRTGVYHHWSVFGPWAIPIRVPVLELRKTTTGWSFPISTQYFKGFGPISRWIATASSINFESFLNWICKTSETYWAEYSIFHQYFRLNSRRILVLPFFLNSRLILKSKQIPACSPSRCKTPSVFRRNNSPRAGSLLLTLIKNEKCFSAN
jgi:hypothetical protein